VKQNVTTKGSLKRILVVSFGLKLLFDCQRSRHALFPLIFAAWLRILVFIIRRQRCTFKSFARYTSFLAYLLSDMWSGNENVERNPHGYKSCKWELFS